MAPLDLENPKYFSSDRIVYPIQRDRHSFYRFFVKVTAEGGSNAFFGDYNLFVGCTSASMAINDNPYFVDNVPLLVGADVTLVYTFYNPTSSLSYCNIMKNEIVNI